MPASHFYPVYRENSLKRPIEKYEMTLKEYDNLKNSLTGEEAYFGVGAEKSEIFFGVLEARPDIYYLFGKWLSTMQSDGIFVGNGDYSYGTFKLELLEDSRTHLRLDFTGKNVRS